MRWTGLWLMAGVLAVSAAQGVPPVKGKRVITIDVKDPRAKGSTQAVDLGVIFVGEDGSLELAEPTAADSRLVGALGAIARRDSLPMRETRVQERGGERVRVSTKIDVPREDPRFAWAVADHLSKKLGVECRVEVNRTKAPPASAP